MTVRINIAAFSLWALMASAAFASASVLETNTKSQITVGPGQKTDVLALKCFDVEAGSYYLSRVAVLDIPETLRARGHDIALVSGHGIDGMKDCIVQDFTGQSRDVVVLKKADNYKAGSDTDWGLIYFKQFPNKHVTRYPLQSVQFENHLAQQKSVKFAKARGLPQNSQTCRLASIEVDTENPNIKKNMITHNCQSIPGQSGTPVTTKVDGVDMLVGIHLGQIWMFKSPLTGRPGRHGYIRPFDDAMIAKIDELLREN